LSVAVSDTVRELKYDELRQSALLQAMLVLGAVGSIWMSWVFVDSTLPALSHDRYFTVVALGALNGAV